LRLAQAPLIRINPRAPAVAGAGGVGIAAGALDALQHLRTALATYNNIS
jgi:hypothetical protein